jgi:large subunit ribosomal protein L16
MIKKFNFLNFKNSHVIKTHKKTNSCHIVSTMYGVLTEKQLEAARRVITRQTDKFVKPFIKIKPMMPLTKKSAESRMGKGKGKFFMFVHTIKPGQKIFEIKGFNNKKLIINISKNAAKKLPVGTKVFF